MLKAVLLVLWSLFLFSAGQAQVFVLPDTNLRNKLLSDYPSVMSGNDLNISAASALTGTLSLNNANISNASGIEYFTGISILNLNFNKLSSIPPIPGLTQLSNFYVTNNQLTSIPSLSASTSLWDFQVQDNQLTSLPSFAGMTALVNIYCQNNQLSSFPPVAALTNLQILDLGNNPLTAPLPDLSTLTNLKQLHVHQTGIDTIPGLSGLTNMDVLFAWGNQIRDLSGLDGNTKLKVFQVFDNALTKLPVLTNKPLTMVSFIDNFLTFEDILPLTSMAGFNSFAYSPQNPINLSSYSLREKDALTINLNIDQSLSTDWYKWYRNGLLLDSNQTGIRVFSSLLASDSGDYRVVISNQSLPLLTLQTTTAHLQIKPCVELNGFTMNTISQSCTDGTNLNFSSLTSAGGIGPFTYGIVPVAKTDTVYAASPDFNTVSPGVYKLILADSRMCKADKEFTVKTPSGCDPVMSPDGDGVMDSYFIQDAGKVCIFDSGKNLIRELNTPAVWDGTKTDGSLADTGYYAIVVNGKKIIHLTIIK
ncbi:MAG: leucine-rich repeat domain-containing protein [Cytophagaceae bacterium]